MWMKGRGVTTHRFTPEEVQEIRTADLTQAALAACYAVSQNTIWQIRNHVTYQGV
jgi:DNA-binding transcriptional regulator YiaG